MIDSIRNIQQHDSDHRDVKKTRNPRGRIEDGHHDRHDNQQNFYNDHARDSQVCATHLKASIKINKKFDNYTVECKPA